jgi:hypothetical protein
VRTVWLGYDVNPYSHLRDPNRIQQSGVIDLRPIISETQLLICGEPVQTSSMLDRGVNWGWQWATEGEALAGHYEVCNAYRHNRRWRGCYLPRLCREQWERLIW